MNTIFIGIAGGTGSGKTTITRRILDEFGGDVSVLYHDNYYKRHDDIPFAEGEVRFHVGCGAEGHPPRT